VELAVKPGDLENFQALTGEMVEATREELEDLRQRFASMVDRIRLTVFGNRVMNRRGCWKASARGI
jgi:hypothetical protein